MKKSLRLVRAGWAGLLLIGLLLPLLTACSAATKTATLLTASAADPTPIPNFTAQATPDYQPAKSLLAKVVKVGPLYVTSNETTPSTALDAAGTILAAMLRNRDDLAAQLRSKGIVLAVFGHKETPCDISYVKDTLDCKSYVGGWSASDTLPVSGCDERGLLKEPDDPYHRGTLPDGSNNCVHLLARTIMRLALSDSDRAAIQARYEAAKKEGIWDGDYAMESAEEFFAEMTQCYFSANVAVARPLHAHAINGPDALKKYDPTTYNLLDSIYRGSINLR